MCRCGWAGGAACSLERRACMSSDRTVGCPCSARPLQVARMCVDEVSLTVFWEAREVGPAREGIQKKPSVNRPSSATFDSALQHMLHP